MMHGVEAVRRLAAAAALFVAGGLVAGDGPGGVAPALFAGHALAQSEGEGDLGDGDFGDGGDIGAGGGEGERGGQRGDGPGRETGGQFDPGSGETGSFGERVGSMFSSAEPRSFRETDDGGPKDFNRILPMPPLWQARIDARRAARQQAAAPAEPVRRRPPPRRVRRAPPRAAQQLPAPPATPPLPSERAGEIIAAGLDDAVVATLVGQGYSLLDETEIDLLATSVVRFEVPPGTTLQAAEATIEAAAPDAIVDVNTIYAPSQEDCEGLGCFQLSMVGWPLEARQAPPACGAGVTIGVVDTGINPDHEALAAADVTVLPLLGDEPQRSRRSHGTAVTAILVGSGDPRIQGLLPEARIVAVDAFEEDPQGRTFSDAFRLVAAVDVVAAQEPDVMNLSLSGPPNELVEAAMDAVGERGILVVAAVGNAGPASPPLYPAAYETVIAATAVDPDLRIYRRAVRGEHVDFSAPGVQVWTAASLRGARPKTGTSFAAPFVTAAAALARQGGAADRAAVLDTLTANASDLGPGGRDPLYGWGLINAAGLCAPASPGAPVTTAAATAGTAEDVFTPAGE